MDITGAILSKVLDSAARWLGRFASAAPEVEVVPAGTKFGWVGSNHILVLTICLCNQSDRPAFLKSLRVKHSGTWYTPNEVYPERISLGIDQGSHHIGLYQQRSAIHSPKVPAMERVERFGVFQLPRPAERWPKQISFVWEAVFIGSRNRKGDYTANERG